MKTKSFLLLSGILALPAYRVYRGCNLKYFQPSEFGAALPFLTVGLLETLDRFRELLGKPVFISPAGRALIRFDTGSESQHVFGRAADVLTSETDPERAFLFAKAAGFTGIGIAPVGVWHPTRLGMHLDTRPGRKPENPAKWGYAKKNGEQIEVPISQVGVINDRHRAGL